MVDGAAFHQHVMWCTFPEKVDKSLAKLSMLSLESFAPLLTERRVKSWFGSLVGVPKQEVLEVRNYRLCSVCGVFELRRWIRNLSYRVQNSAPLQVKRLRSRSRIFKIFKVHEVQIAPVKGRSNSGDASDDEDKNRVVLRMTSFSNQLCNKLRFLLYHFQSSSDPSDLKFNWTMKKKITPRRSIKNLSHPHFAAIACLWIHVALMSRKLSGRKESELIVQWHNPTCEYFSWLFLFEID